jgi:hypothetical protein
MPLEHQMRLIRGEHTALRAEVQALRELLEQSRAITVAANAPGPANVMAIADVDNNMQTFDRKPPGRDITKQTVYSFHNAVESPTKKRKTEPTPVPTSVVPDLVKNSPPIEKQEADKDRQECGFNQKILCAAESPMKKPKTDPTPVPTSAVPALTTSIEKMETKEEREFNQMSPGQKILYAAVQGKTEWLERVLITNPECVDHDDEDGNTGVAKACWKGHIGCLRAFIRHGVKLDKQNRYGWTPYQHARRGNHRACIRAILTSNLRFQSWP